MNELVIKTHDFNDALKQLQKFSKNIPSTIDLQSIATKEGLFGLFDHKVTGDEINSLTTQIQNYLITISNMNIGFIKEIKHVYVALQALDKDYIQAIILNIKQIEKVSNQANENAYEAKKNNKDIIKTMEALEETFNALKHFKDQIDKYKHLKNIDKIWNDCQNLKKEIKSIGEIIKQLGENTGDGTSYRNEFNSQLNENKIIYETQIKKLSKQLKFLYILAGASIGITLISFVLNIIGII